MVMNERIAQMEELTAEAVGNVFQCMLSMEVAMEPPMPLADEGQGQIVGSVGFVGKATGIIYLNAGVHFAKVITSRMLGIPEAEIDEGEMVSDAFGELCNMVVGRVKSRLCDKGWSCTLTIPSIVRGQRMTVENSPQVEKKIIGFRSGDYHLLVDLLLKH